MRILFVLVVLAVVVSVGMLVEMSRRNRPELGLSALGILTVAAILAATYGGLTAE
jgi:hypothetical protein